MKSNFLSLLRAVILGNLILLAACSKKDLDQPPVKNPPVLSPSVQWTIEQLPGLPQGPVNDLYALVTVVNERNEAVLTNKKLAINWNGLFKTESLDLPAASHKVTGFILADGAGIAKFASPKAGSSKAGQVGRPLDISFTVPQPSPLAVPMEVLPVQIADKPEDFGYPAGSFNNGGQNPPGEPNNLIRVNLRVAIQVGDLHYDSIPATVLYTYWDEQQSFGKYISLSAGINEVYLPRNASRHHFRMTKWGVNHELALLKTEVQEGNLYVLGGTRQAKKLRSELTYILVNGSYKPDTKMQFSYQDNGKLSEIQYYARKPDNSIYMTKREEFQYSGNQLQKSNCYDEYNNYSGFTSFAYNVNGKVNRIVEEAGTGIQTVALVDYHFSPVTRLTEVIFNYSYSHNSIGMNYYQRYADGNRISDNSTTTNHSTETGEYAFDNNINPYAHMGWLNLFLSNASKNNMVSQQKTFYGNYPVAVAYSFSYKYDADGYPVELVKQYKSYQTGQHLYTTKTVFNY